MGVRDGLAEALRRLPPGLHRSVPAGVRRRLRHRLRRYYAWEFGFDHHVVPVLQPGEVDGPPDFVGIGVQKAGTSWWYRLIVDHPGASARATIHKERHFFARFGVEPFGSSEIADYHRWFPRIAGTVTGEWTPDYVYYPWVPPLMRRAAPEAKLLLILRDPVERLRSGLVHQLREGTGHVGVNLAEAVGRSLYAESVHRWLDHFPTSQFLVLQYEQCVAQPVEQLESTYAFLGLNIHHRPAALDRVINRTPETKVDLSDDVFRRLLDIFAPDLAELAKLLPALDLSLWPSAKHSVLRS